MMQHRYTDVVRIYSGFGGCPDDRERQVSQHQSILPSVIPPALVSLPCPTLVALE